MRIINNDLNSMPQQVEENKKNIKLLAQYLKEAYNTSFDLGDSAVSIAISDTNATTDTTDGWLITHDGYLYKITSGDGTNLLLEYYTYIRGEKGDDGAALEIDDNTTSNEKVWSSEKTNEMLTNGTYHTLTQPTLNGAIYELDIDDIVANNDLKLGDNIIYIDGNNEIDSIYSFMGVSGTTAILSLIGTSFKGKPLYRHMIHLYCTDGNYTTIEVDIDIINDSNEAFTWNSLGAWLEEHNFTMAMGLYYPYAYGTFNSGANTKLVMGIYTYGGLNAALQGRTITPNSATGSTGALYPSRYAITDTIFNL